MTTERELKQQLQTIAGNDYQVPEGAEPFKLAQAMLAHIGSTDYNLRDGLIYTTFAKWILKQKLFTDEQLKQILAIVTDENHLFYGLGETKSDSVFTRAFSMLLLPLIIIYHRERPFLSVNEVQQTKQSVITYLGQEQDRRGYVPDKGWAHAIAHAADAIDDLSLCEELGAADLLELLQVAQEQIATPHSVYIHEEDERMSYAIVNLLKRNVVAEADIQGWLDAFVLLVDQEGDMPGSLYRRVNVKNFLRCLYFRARRNTLADNLCEMMYQTAEKVTRF